MKKFFLAIALAFCPCVVSVAQQTEPPLVQGQPPILTEDSARIVLNTNKHQFKGGEDVILTIGLKNEGVKPFKIVFDDVDYFYQFKVTDSSGKALPFLPLHDRRLTGSSDGCKIQPGQTKEALLWLSHFFDVSKKGKYRVIVSKQFQLNKDVITVDSEPLTFEVISDPPAGFQPTDDQTVGGWK